MSVVGRQLVELAMAHGLDSASIWEMTLREFAAAIGRWWL